MSRISDHITPAHAKEVCRSGQGAYQCKYLAEGKGYACGKVWSKSTRKALVDPLRGAKGNNCSGPPDFSQKSYPKAMPKYDYLGNALASRHHELVDKKHINGKLSRLEARELTAIGRLMDIREVPYYAGTIKRLRRIVKARTK